MARIIVYIMMTASWIMIVGGAIIMLVSCGFCIKDILYVLTRL